tara:strand:+ start:733 stop:858 length:126 start_codon:yes stop_codon:yes gene_type:complete
LKTISDLQKLDLLLKNRNFFEIDIEKILHKNAIDFLMNATH